MYTGEGSASISRLGLFLFEDEKDKQSIHPWIPISTFLDAARFFLPLRIDIGT